MRLSACLIVRDEAARLAAALASVAGVADEIVVLDTGSTDGTPDLAERLGARVFRADWIDDFAAVRNQAHALTRGEWILWLDADERLENPQALPQTLDGQAYRVTIVDGDVESHRVRLFRRGARLVGRIHERFEPPLRAQPCGLRLRHEGYVGGPSQAKHRRNLPLLDAELRESPERLDIRIERARTLAAVGSPHASAALQDALHHVDPLRPASVPHVAMLVEAFLAHPEASGPAWLAAYAEREFPDSPPLRWLLAHRAATCGDLAGARRHLERLVEMGERRDYDRSLGFDFRLLGSQPRLQLAGVLVGLGELARARSIFESLVGDPEVGQAAHANLQAVIGMGGSS